MKMISSKMPAPSENARAYITDPTTPKIERDVIRILLERGIGHKNAIPLSVLATELNVTRNAIQNRVVVPSRSSKNRHFVGSCYQGIFLIETQEDVKVMLEFYDRRVAAEQAHRNLLVELTTD